MVILVLNHLSYNIFVEVAVKKFVKTIKMYALCPWIQVSFKLQLNESRRHLQSVLKPSQLIDMFMHNKLF